MTASKSVIRKHGFGDREQFVQHLLDVYKKNTSSIIDIEEFRNDLSRAMYVSRILRRYANKNILNAPLLINHLVIMYNCFSSHATVILLEYIDEKIHPQLLGVLEYFSRLPVEYKTETIDHSIKELLDQEIGK